MTARAQAGLTINVCAARHMAKFKVFCLPISTPGTNRVAGAHSACAVIGAPIWLSKSSADRDRAAWEPRHCPRDLGRKRARPARQEASNRAYAAGDQGAAGGEGGRVGYRRAGWAREYSLRAEGRGWIALSPPVECRWAAGEGADVRLAVLWRYGLFCLVMRYSGADLRHSKIHSYIWGCDSWFRPIMVSSDAINMFI